MPEIRLTWKVKTLQEKRDDKLLVVKIVSRLKSYYKKGSSFQYLIPAHQCHVIPFATSSILRQRRYLAEWQDMIGRRGEDVDFERLTRGSERGRGATKGATEYNWIDARLCARYQSAAWQRDLASCIRPHVWRYNVLTFSMRKSIGFYL